MKFHDRGYVSGDPRVQPAEGVGLDRPEDLPTEIDVLIVGGGPAGHVAAAQLAQFPGVTTRLIERRGGRLDLGQADGIQARSVETFQAFGFAGPVMEEGYRITAMAFWGPDQVDSRRIVRTALTADDPAGVSEFPHLIVNQARIQDYFAEAMQRAPTRMTPDFGVEFVGLEIASDDDPYPVHVRIRYVAGPRSGEERTLRVRYVLGADGARSAVRTAIGRRLEGDQAMHAWGVMDVLTVTDFPDIRTKCAISSRDGGSILLIPREGGHLVRFYVDLGEVPADDRGAVRRTPLGDIVARANAILRPYTVEVKACVWHSVYEVAHRLTDRFDDVDEADVGARSPRVFIAGDACHTHSAKAGQGMNVSIQDGWNIGWKLGHVADGRARPELLATYSAERQVIAKDLIDFDKRWSALMASRPDERTDPTAVEDFYLKTFEFPAGFMTQYAPSILTAPATHQDLASGFPIGKRFRSARVVRVCDANPLHLGHQARADGRWRIYVFADSAPAGEESPLAAFAEWLEGSPESPVARAAAATGTIAKWFDTKVVYQQRFDDVDLGQVPAVFRPCGGPLGLVDLESVFAAGTGPDGEGEDIFELRGIDRDGAVVVVRPDQYVSAVLPLDATDELTEFFEAFLIAPYASVGASSSGSGRLR